MRILYHHRTLADGAEGIHIHEMVGAFEKLGHSVAVQALAKPAARGAGHVGALAQMRARMPQALYESAALVYNLPEYMRFRRVLRREKPAFVYKRHALYDVGVCLAARAEGVPLVLEVNRPYSDPRYHDFEPLRFRAAAARLERQAFEAATVVAVVSTPLRRLVLDRGIDANKVLLTPNGANPERFVDDPRAGAELRRALGIDAATVVGWAGILREWHHLDLLIDAMAALPAMRLLIIGDGPDRPRLEAHARERGVSSQIIFTGRISHAEMPRYLSALDIAVASDDRTGVASPMKILEYMAMGKPVVAPRMANIEDLVCDGQDGILFTARDTTDLIAALRRLQDDTRLRQSLGAAARRKIERQRNWRCNALQVLEKLESLAPQSASVTPTAT